MIVDLEFQKKTSIVEKYLFKAIARKVFYNNIKSFKIVKDGGVVGYLINDKNRNIPSWYFKERGFALEPTKHILLEWSLNEIEPVTITEDFWTCECDDHWIHHVTQMNCPVCYCKWTDDTKRNTILKGGVYGFSNSENV